MDENQVKIVPVVREEIHVDKQTRENGKVTIHVTPQARQETIDVALRDEQVQVQRVPINRPVDTPPSVRQEGDVTIVPVFEEVLVVEKRLILKEEIRITRVRNERHERQTVTLHEEQVRIVRSQPPPPGHDDDTKPKKNA
jgi:uncharacterized protein (TIGR02271 family)